ncbi:phage head closure protein [Novosphingobium sp. KN65.2]|uniref:phage head closure protein n=1 Tax=Novosphingobium sp. KN65.2 TaxID=1478134 RepID=UPI0005E0FB37|nr:phage head closure protein [Novosphingobium sp. KN65.2]CDO37144.1 putative Phage head-tail adaptor [Novosphingobium sp. KN65.2]
MKPAAGRRDTLITFQSRTGSQDSATGAYTYSWADLASNPTEWAEVQDMLPSRAERIADSVSIQRRPCRVRTLYRSDITSDMRITFEGRALQIVAGPAELGRRDGLEMLCEEMTTEGDAP